MKLTKVFKIFASVLLAGLLFHSCSNAGDEADVYINVSNRLLNFNLGASYQSVTVSSNVEFTVASSHPEWCDATVIPNYQTGNVRITVSKNESMDSRQAEITISAKGARDVDISVIQAGIAPALTVSQKNIPIDKNDQREFKLDVYANVPIVFDTPAWISEKGGNGWESGMKAYNFIVSPLPADVPQREATVTVRAVNSNLGLQPELVSVVQKEEVKPKTHVIAHRGFWTGTAQNSLQSLQRAIDNEFYGSEFDVYITLDGVLVVNHDPTIKINGTDVNIELSNYSAIAGFRLSNGEPIPKLQEYIDVAKKQTKTKLIMEIKSHTTKVNEDRAVAAAYKMVNDNNVAHLVDYISFSQNICNELIKANKQNRVAYLNGNLTPEQLYNAGYWGLDYNESVLSSNPGWIAKARELGLTSNVWTVNSTSTMQYFIDLGVDYITTDSPLVLKGLLEK
jgi:glycerophosphoryl diester phosphodiesterase